MSRRCQPCQGKGQSSGKTGGWVFFTAVCFPERACTARHLGLYEKLLQVLHVTSLRCQEGTLHLEVPRQGAFSSGPGPCTWQCGSAGAVHPLRWGCALQQPCEPVLPRSLSRRRRRHRGAHGRRAARALDSSWQHSSTTPGRSWAAVYCTVSWQQVTAREGRGPASE